MEGVSWKHSPQWSLQEVGGSRCVHRCVSGEGGVELWRAQTVVATLRARTREQRRVEADLSPDLWVPLRGQL